MVHIRSITQKDRDFVTTVLKNLWGSEQIVYSGKVFDASSLPGFLAEEEGRIVGLVTYLICHPGEATTSIGSRKDSLPDSGLASAEASHSLRNDKYCQIISINSLTPGKGIGTALIDAIKKEAQKEDCQKLVVITTNDNLGALKFYKKKGFVVKAVYKGAVAKSRAIKPQIPLIGENGIPLEDEIELEMKL